MGATYRGVNGCSLNEALRREAETKDTRTAIGDGSVVGIAHGGECLVCEGQCGKSDLVATDRATCVGAADRITVL